MVFKSIFRSVAGKGCNAVMMCEISKVKKLQKQSLSSSQNDTPPTHQFTLYFELTTLLCKFVGLIEKDGGIRPCEVLATCAYKVLRSTYPLQKWIGKISESQFL
jgi:hypothetical protein